MKKYRVIGSNYLLDYVITKWLTYDEASWALNYINDGLKRHDLVYWVEVGSEH